MSPSRSHESRRDDVQQLLTTGEEKCNRMDHTIRRVLHVATWARRHSLLSLLLAHMLRRRAGAKSIRARRSADRRALTFERVALSARAGLLHVLSSGTLRALHDVELHRITLGQALEAVALNGAVV